MKRRYLLLDEIKKSIFNKGMLLTILLGTIIVVLHIKNYMNFSLRGAIFLEDDRYRTFCTETVIDFWMINSISPYLYYLYYLIPFIAVLPYGLGYYRDKKTGVEKNVLIRQERTQYASNKYIASFISGGLATMYPIVLALAFVMMLVPIRQKLPFWTSFTNPHWLEKLCFTNPAIYILIYFLIYFLVGGILSCLSLIISTITQNMLTVFLSPFLFMICLLFIQERLTVYNNNLTILKYFPYKFMICCFAEGGTIPIIIVLILLAILGGLLFSIRIKKTDVF